MNKFLFTAMLAAVLAGCSLGVPDPSMTLNTFEDYSYPCVKIQLGEPLEYVSKKKYESGNVINLQYTLALPARPSYEIKVVKKYVTAENEGWLMEPVSEMYDENVIIYKIDGDGVSDKSAVLALIEKNGDIYLRSITGEAVSRSEAYMVLADRLVQKSSFRHLFIFDKWKESVAGKKIIKDMINFTDIIYDNTILTDCRVTTRLDEGVK